ncbi:MAG: hypothetical protein ACRDGQ_15125 [Candidatus Limnocylindrales bacterium]
MRIRQIKPSFWSDSNISDLADATRLFYVGLWMIADDAGWLRWDCREVARDLYGYETVRRREARVERMIGELESAGRVRRYPCGHVEIPTLPAHQHLGSATKQVKTVFNQHLRGCLVSVSPQIPADTRGASQSPDTVRNGKERERLEVRNGTERNGNARASANDDEGVTEFRRLVDRDMALGVAK